MPPVPDGLDGREKLGIILTGPSQVVADELSRHFCCPFDERLCREALSQVRYLNQTRLARCNGLPHGAGWVVVGHPFGFFHFWREQREKARGDLIFLEEEGNKE